MAGAPNESSGSTSRRYVTANAAPPICSTSALPPAKSHNRCEGPCSASKSDMAARGFSNLGFALPNTFERDQLDPRVAARAQDFQNAHQLSIGNGAIGTQ